MLRIIIYIAALGAIIGLLISAGIYISPQDDLVPADSIVVLSGGDTSARTLEAVKLHQEGWAPFLIFSGAAEDPNSPSNAQVMRSIAIGQGVPPDVIAIEERSKTTHQNASEVSGIVRVFHHRRIILVTSPYHQRRAALEFQARLGPDVTIINRPAPDRVWSRHWWWTSPLGWYLTLTEIPKTTFTLINQQLSQQYN